MVRQLMRDELPIRDFVHGAKIRWADLLGPAAAVPLLLGLAGYKLLGRFHQSPVMLPSLVLVSDDLSGAIGGRSHLAHMSGSVIVPSVLILAHELERARLTRQLMREDE